MLIRRRICILASIVTCLFLQAQGADKYTDGNRPYEFGFSIDGEQHRHEKKDEKGLIEGEFGFITADGVYHVTVYATDEQGRFKILSMKNIRVKPYPTYTAKDAPTSARQGHSLELPAASATSSPPVFTTSTFKPISIEPPARSCSHCSIPTTSTSPPIAANLFSNNPNLIGIVESPKLPQGIKPQTFSNQPTFGNSPSVQQGSNYPEQPQNNFNVGQNPLSQDLVPPLYPQDFQQQKPAQNSVPGSYQQEEQGPGSNNPLQPLQGPGSSNPIQSSGVPSIPQQQPQAPGVIPQSTYNENIPSGRTPKRLDNAQSFGPPPQPNGLQRSSPDRRNEAGPTKPTLISAQMQIVDKNTDIYSRKPGENEGLPKGLTKDDMTTLLYTFNYTVGFHGHFEEGYTNGAKQGYYYVTGRNGVRTRVDYVADANGFRPKISQEVLDLLSDDVPKPETEKEEKYGLKGYEFKWLYYPVEAKGR